MIREQREDREISSGFGLWRLHEPGSQELELKIEEDEVVMKHDIEARGNMMEN